MGIHISTKTGREKVLRHVVHNRKGIVSKTELKQETTKAAPRTDVVTEKERRYFEYLIENEPLLQDTVGLLIDGDAYPCEYSGNQEPPLENSAHIHWGRVVRNISESVNFSKTSPDVVEASIVTTIEGAMKISAPYHLSRRKRHAVLFKPFQETCTRKVLFHRISRSTDPSQAWKVAMISGGQGGTTLTEMTIDALWLNLEGESIEAHSAFQHSFILNGNKHATPLLKANQQVDIAMTVRSKEMEQNMIAIRSMACEDTPARVQLQLQGDSRQDVEYCQTYSGKMRAGALPGIQSIVVEAISRSSLYETGSPISSNFWIFPVVIL